MEIKLPNYVLYCLNMLENNGFEAFCVGGAIRDHIMGKTPFDYDITTNAKPEDIINIFPKTVPTGIQHGTVTVVTDDGIVEITTYRTDGEYLDHRAPENVTFVNTVDDDLSRRDFTMNAICYNPKSGFYDPKNGIEDINKKLIRAIGDPQKRFLEDALRIMRAFRFSAQLGFEIEENTKNAAISLSNLLQDISVERVYSEFKRALCGKYAKKFEPLTSAGALKYLGLTADKIFKEIEQLPNDFALRIAYLCHVSGDNVTYILKRLKAANVTSINANSYMWLLNQPIPKSKIDLKFMLKKSIIPLYIQRLFDVYTVLGIDTKNLHIYLKEILDNNEPYLLNMLDIRGEDLTKLGFHGAEIGEKLHFLLDEVIKDPTLNVKDRLIEKLK